jgi:protease-4
MKRFIKWFLIISAIFCILIAAAFLIVFWMLDTQPAVQSNSYLSMNLGGIIHEYRAPEALEELMNRSSLDMNGIRQVLKMAAVDHRIRGIVLKINYLQTGFAKLQELHQLIATFRESGKKVLVSFDFATIREYYLATACDSIYLAPGGTLLLPGLSAEITFYKGLLNKIGVEADFVNIGKYKNAPDIFTRQTMSDAQKEVIDEILDSRFEEVISTIATMRNLPKNRIINLINNISGFTAKEALNYHLIDGIKYSDQLDKILNKDKKDLSELAALEYVQVSPSSVGIGKGPRVAVIYCTGTITGGEDGDDFLTGDLMGAERVIRDLEDAADAKSIRAIILRVDSPGGSGLDSDNIWYAIIKAKEKKPVIASISDLGASGGYYIAMAADTILAQPASLIGSIGVFAGKFSVDKLYKKLDLNTVMMKRGDNAGIFSLSSKFSDSERGVILKLIEDFYLLFVQKVAQSRNKTEEEIKQIAQGRVWLGENGLQNGLIDYFGGLDEAIRVAKKMAKIDPGKDVKLVYYPKKRSFLSQILKYITYEKYNMDIQLIAKVESYFNQFQTKPLALMPFFIEIK